MLEWLIEWLPWIFVGLMIYLFFMFRQVQKRKKQTQQFLAKTFQYEMTTKLECKKCGKVWTRPFKDFEYMLQTVEECCGEALILGIYHEGKCPEVGGPIPSYS